MVSRRRFEQLVAEAVDALPDWVAERMENVEVLVEDEPPDGEPLLGLYEGIPLTDRGVYVWALPDRITLFRSMIEREAGGDEDRLRAVIRDTIVHEVAHHFGISDRRLRELGAD